MDNNLIKFISRYKLVKRLCLFKKIISLLLTNSGGYRRRWPVFDAEGNVGICKQETGRVHGRVAGAAVPQTPSSRACHQH